jgi:hypothetical protein
MTARKGKGVSSLMSLTETRRNESETEGLEKPKATRRKMLESYKMNRLPLQQQRIVEIIYDAIPVGEEGYLNVQEHINAERISRPAFSSCFQCLGELGYIEILPTIERPVKGTRIRVLKEYTPVLSGEHLRIYYAVAAKAPKKPGKEYAISMMELSVETRRRQKRLLSRLNQLELRGYIKIPDLERSPDANGRLRIITDAEGKFRVKLTGLTPREKE